MQEAGQGQGVWMNVRRAQPHHILPETGWVSFYLRQDDVEQAIALLHESYEIAQRQKI